jgi:hypothetical protein
MNDPKRLLDEAPGTFARELMASSSEDVPPLQAKERARAALFAGAVGLSVLRLRLKRVLLLRLQLARRYRVQLARRHQWQQRQVPGSGPTHWQSGQASRPSR